MAKTTVKIKENKKAAILIFGVFIILGALLVNLTLAAPPNKTSTTTTTGPSFGLYLNPLKTSVTVGTQISETVSANLSTNSVQSMSAYIHYDPTFLRLDTVDQTGVDPAYSVTTRCSALDGCKPTGEIVLIAGYTGTGSIQPKDNLLLGNLKFTTLKSGTTSVTIDPDTKLSGFASTTTDQSTLNSRQVSNSSVSIINKKGHK